MKSPISKNSVIWYSNSRGICQGRKFWIMPNGDILLQSKTTGKYILSSWDIGNKNRYFRAIRDSLCSKRLNAQSSWNIRRLSSGVYSITILPGGQVKKFQSCQAYLTWSDWLASYHIYSAWDLERSLQGYSHCQGS